MTPHTGYRSLSNSPKLPNRLTSVDHRICRRSPPHESPVNHPTASLIVWWPYNTRTMLSSARIIAAAILLLQLIPSPSESCTKVPYAVRAKLFGCPMVEFSRSYGAACSGDCQQSTTITGVSLDSPFYQYRNEPMCCLPSYEKKIYQLVKCYDALVRKVFVRVPLHCSCQKCKP
eukprot:m.169464 g.169464  ORF g.169464 m.169464 type:complete len:174 (+) comp38999_c0_seq3:861-1382(+)